MSLPDYEVFAIRYATVNRMAVDNFMLHDDHDGMMPLDFFIWAIRSGTRCIVVDTGFSDCSAQKRNREFLCRPEIGLAELGIAAGEVSDVVLTHLHYDHAGNFGLFKRANFHLQDAEMAYATGRQMAHRVLNHFFAVEDVTGLVKEVYAGRVRFHDGDAEIAPGVSVHKVGGHTEGLQVVRVHTKRGWLVLASDAAHYYANLDESNPFPAITNVGEMLDGYQRLYALADTPDHIIPGHDPEVLKLYPHYCSELAEIACLHLLPVRIASRNVQA
jgi:glyoxylase-like metal-dependent hydrolase (beta-lactamase superfamily II)